MNTFIKKIITIIILFSTIFLFGSCNKKFSAYDSAKNSYNYMHNAYNLMYEYNMAMENTYSYVTSRESFSLEAYCNIVKLSNEELAYGIAKYYIPENEWNNATEEVILQYGNSTHFNTLLKEVSNRFDTCASILEIGNAKKGTFDVIDNKLAKAKKSLKEIAINEPDYPFYQNLKDLYFNLVEFNDNLNNYNDYITYKSDMALKRVSCEYLLDQMSFEFGE